MLTLYPFTRNIQFYVSFTNIFQYFMENSIGISNENQQRAETEIQKMKNVETVAQGLNR